MKFTTPINIDPLEKKIEHNNSIFTIGSCFAENIGSFFQRYKFNSIINPFGVLYNSTSILNSLKSVADKKEFKQKDLVYEQGEWHSFFHHSDFSHHDKNVILHNINTTTKKTYDFLKNVDWVIVSLGTSYVYEHKATNMIVSNCHKIPQKEFEKRFLFPEENFKNISEIIRIQKSLNPDTNFILTVSPVRHMKDGAHNNQLSKSSLLLTIEEIDQSFDAVYYFPSYELMVDELRDYRFYDKDLIHPSEQAIEYIWEKFTETSLSDDCKNLVIDISKITKAANHRIRNKKSKKSKEFFRKQLSKIKKLQVQHPNLDLSQELKTFSSYLDDSNN